MLQISSAVISILMALSLSLSTAKAAIWVTQNQWSPEWEQKYALWVSGPEVKETMFTDQNSPFFGVRADCADAAHALRIIFSYKNALPFAVLNPSGNRNPNNPYQNFHNEIDHFDRIANPNQRVVAFINYLGSSMGSEFLTRYNTFPLALDKISSGDMFTYRIRARFGKFIRHVYNIKNVNPTGSFDVIYATQAIKDKGLPMIRRKEREFVHAPFDVWGFKRFRWPEYIGKPLSSIPASLGNSQEQYAVVEEQGERFFTYLRNRLRSEVESPQAMLQRTFSNLCIEANSRVEYVQQGVDFMNSIGGKCMDYAQYDAYSTPARDEALKQSFARTKQTYDEIVRNSQEGQVDPDLLGQVASVFYPQYANYRSQLLSTCPISFKRGSSLDLAELHRRQKANLLSSHPNDTLEHRWGEGSGRRTRCKAHY